MNKAQTVSPDPIEHLDARHRIRHPTLPRVTLDWFHGGGFVPSDLIVRVNNRFVAMLEAFEA